MDFDEEEDGLEGLDEVAGLREVGALDLPFVGGLGAIGISLMGYDRTQYYQKTIDKFDLVEQMPKRNKS